MASGIEFNFSVGEKKRKRQTEAAAIAQRLIETTDLDPNEVNAVAAHYVKTGEYKLPTSRQVPAAGPSLPGGAPPTAEIPRGDFRREMDVYQLGDNGLLNRGRVSRGSRIIPAAKPTDSDDQDVYMYDESGVLKNVGRIPRKSKVIAKPKAEPEDPLAALIKNRGAKKNGPPAIPGSRSYMESGESDATEEEDTDDLETQAASWLKANGAPVTPANIQAVIKKGLVKIGGD